MIQQAISESFVTGFRVVMLITVVLALASALIAWLTISEPALTERGASERSKESTGTFEKEQTT